MIAGVIGLAGPLFDDDPFPVAWLAGQFRIHIILAIAALREASFTVVKRPPADIPRRGLALAILDHRQEISRLLRRLLGLVTCRSASLKLEGCCGITCSSEKGVRVLCCGCDGIVGLRDRASGETDHECQAEEYRRYNS